MTTVEYPKPCELCGQPVEIEGFYIDYLDVRKCFCCAGCQSIYQLFEKIGRQTEHQSTPITTTKNNEEN